MCKSEIEIDGVCYVKKDAVLKLTENYVIIRTYSAGVHAGYLASRKDKEVKLTNARRIFYWDGAASLSQMAVDGVSKPQNCKFSVVVPEITLTEAIEIIPCTDKARNNIEGVQVWKM